MRNLIRGLVFRVVGRVAYVLANMAEEYRRARTLRDLNIGDRNIVLRPGVTITHPERIEMGTNIMLNHGTMIFAGGGVRLGNDIVAGPGCMLVTGNHRGEVFYGSIESRPIAVGNNVWLGARVVVTPGVTIGSNIIVSAGAVVTEDLPDGGIYGGVPARRLKDLILPFEPSGKPDSGAGPDGA